MASHASALKAHKQSLARRDRNRQYRTRLRRALKALRSAISDGQTDEVKATYTATVSLIDKMAGKGIIHANAAGRYKSRLVRRVASASA